MNNLILDLIASLSFYFIPYLTGRLLVKKPVQAWIIGALAWFITYFAVFAASSIIKFDFALVIRLLAVVVSVASLFKLLSEFLKGRPELNFKALLSGLFLLGLTAFIYFFIWIRNTPYPLSLNWDIYEHIALANLISSGKLALFTPQISDTYTFNSYSPLFAILLSLPKIVFGRSLLGVYWWLNYWHYFVTAAAAFYLAKKVFSNYWLAFLSAIFSSLIFESVVAYSTLFLIPQTLVAVVAVLVAAEIKDYKWPMLFAAAALILLLHYVVGVVCILALAAFFIVSHVSLPKPVFNLSIIASALFAAVLILLNLIVHWSVPGVEEASHFNFSLWQKMGFFDDWFGILLLVFGLLGAFKIIKSGTYSQKILLGVGLIVLGISLAPFSYFLKFFVLGHYFWTLIMAAGAWLLIANLHSVVKVFCLVFVTFVLLITFYENQLTYKQPLNFHNLQTQISPVEISAGDWLASQKQNGQALLISDPATQYILEAVSGVNSQGGMYMDLNTRRILESINGYYSLGDVKTKLTEVKDL